MKSKVAADIWKKTFKTRWCKLLLRLESHSPRQTLIHSDRERKFALEEPRSNKFSTDGIISWPHLTKAVMEYNLETFQ